MQIKKCSPIDRRAFPLSDCLFNVPDEGSEPEHRAVFVETVEFFEQWVDLTVFHNCDDGTGKAGPSVAAVVRLTFMAAAPLHVGEGCVATAVAVVENLHYLLIVGLVEGYEY